MTPDRKALAAKLQEDLDNSAYRGLYVGVSRRTVHAVIDALAASPIAPELLTESCMFELIEKAANEFRYQRSAIRGQQLVPADDPNYVLARFIEAEVRKQFGVKT